MLVGGDLSVVGLLTDKSYKARSSNVEDADIVLLGLDFSRCSAVLGLAATGLGDYCPLLGK